MSDNNTDKGCLDPENKDKCCFFKVANAFLLLANMLLLIVGFYYLPSKNDNSYFSVIVAVLAILVTVLITWQIYRTIEWEKRIKEIEENNNSIQKSLLFQKDYADAATTYLHANLLFHRATNSVNKNARLSLYANAYIKYYTALGLFLKTTTDAADDCISKMETCSLQLFPESSKYEDAKFHSDCETQYDIVSENFSKLSRELRDKFATLRKRRKRTPKDNFNNESGD